MFEHVGDKYFRKSPAQSVVARDLRVDSDRLLVILATFFQFVESLLKP